jgi:PAS domain S-box-containing protein
VQHFLVSDFEKRLADPEAWRNRVEDLKRTSYLVFDGINLNQKTGMQFPAEVTVRFVVIGGKGYVIASSRDVTERKLAEQKLRESERRLNDVLAIIGEGVWDWNLRTNRVWHSRKWADIVGFEKPESEHTAAEFDAMIYPPDREFAIGALQQALKEDGHFESEFRIVRSCGTLIWIRDQGYVAERDEAGLPVRVLGSLSNISERKRYELELKAHHDILNKLANQLPGMVYQFQLFPDGRMVFPYASRGVADIYGLTPEQVYQDVNSSLYILHPDDRERVLTSIQHSAQTLETWQLEYRVRVPGTGEGWRAGVAKPEKLEDGSILWHGYIQDITGRKLAEAEMTRKNEALQKANEELDRFVYSTSHDLRAPLMSVLGLVDLCQQIEPEHPELKTYFSMMRQAVNRLDNTIKNILDYSRNTRVGPVLEVIDMHELIESHIDTIRHMSEAHAVTFEVDVRAHVPFVSDRLRIATITNNLITNAIKYQRKNEPQPRVAVSFSCGATAAVLTVTDNGEGIPSHQYQRIFEMFVRNSSQSTGSGLGLYMCREMAERLGGTIAVTSQVGAGSTFTVTIPNHPFS